MENRMSPESSSTILATLLLWLPSLVLGMVLAWSTHKEPRRFRNAILFLCFAWTFLNTVLVAIRAYMLVTILCGLMVISPFAAIIGLLLNGRQVLKREGLRLANALPTLLALAIVGVFAFPFALAILRAPTWTFFLALAVWASAFWAALTLVSLLAYSWFYQHLPRKTSYDYIIVHGAGLMPDGTPTPLLAGRINKAAELWRKQGERPIIVASGGQGADEAQSEAQAISTYLQDRCGVPAQSIILEDQSTTTRENLIRSKELLDARTEDKPYRCCLVTSDYHVFRAVELAHKCGLAADGVGSRTASYYFPTAFLREYVAITRAHWWPYGIICALGIAASLFLAFHSS